MEELEEAIRRVYASTMNEQAIEYRRKRHLLDVDEQMALLIQQVAGQQYGDLYMPVAAGMGCSYNPYKWMEHLNPEAGMLRMVMGLGTRAVERTPGDYPRLIGLDRAQANLRTTLAERHKFSQRKVDVLDFGTKSLCTKSLEKILDLFPKMAEENGAEQGYGCRGHAGRAPYIQNHLFWGLPGPGGQSGIHTDDAHPHEDAGERI